MNKKDITVPKENGKYEKCTIKTETGKWDGVSCSVCGYKVMNEKPKEWLFCPHCGVKID